MMLSKVINRGFPVLFAGVSLKSTCSNLDSQRSDSPSPKLLMCEGFSGKFYTSNLDLQSVVPQLQSFKNDIHAAIMRDCECAQATKGVTFTGKEYLHEIVKRKKANLSFKKLCGRKETVSYLQLAALKGRLTVLIGAPSVGKSLMTKEFVTSLAALGVGALNVNGRDYTCSSLAKSVIRACKLSAARISDQKFSQSKCDFSDLNLLSSTDNEVSSAMRKFAHVKPSRVSEPYSHNLLVIEEVNRFLEAENTESTKHQTQELFDAAVMLTKETNEMSVLLVGSCVALPYFLKDAKCNLTHIQNTIVVGEPSPHDITTLLREEWGVGPHLCQVLTDVLGGHLYQISALLDDLANDIWEVKGAFTGPFRNVRGALNAAEEAGVLHHTMIMMKEIARSGYYRVDTSQDEVVAELLVRQNVCSSILPGTFAEHIPAHIREDNWILAPNLQLTRLIIVSEISNRCGG